MQRRVNSRAARVAAYEARSNVRSMTFASHNLVLHHNVEFRSATTRTVLMLLSVSTFTRHWVTSSSCGSSSVVSLHNPPSLLLRLPVHFLAYRCKFWS